MMREEATTSDSRVDFVLITALPEERDAVLDRLSRYQQLPPAKDDIRTYFQADLPVTFPDNSAGTYRVIVMCLLGMGRVQAVTATADAIRRWRPHYILLVGIAGGVAARNVQVGDILISDQIVDYELQKLTTQGPEIRWDVQRADPRLLDACNNFRGEQWQELIQIKRPDTMNPARHTGPIASGDKVVAFGDVLERYRDVWPKLIGVEMEAAGVATAAFQSPDKPGFFMVRGVSDLADKDKDSSDVEKWRSYACAAAASFAVALLKRGPVPLSAKMKQVELTLEGEFGEFTSNRRQDVVNVLAALLRIEPNAIQILQVYRGSIVIVMEMPDSAANRLYEMVTVHDFRIKSLGIVSVLIEGRERLWSIDTSKKTKTQQENTAISNQERSGGINFGSGNVQIHGDAVAGDKVTNISGDQVSGNKTVVNTGGGAYVGGNVSVSGGGKFVGRDDNSTTGLSAEDVVQLFESIYKQIDAKPDLKPSDKEDLKADVQDVQAEVAKGEEADESFLERRLRSIKRMAPDILEVIVNTFVDPAAGAATVIRKVMTKAKADAKA